MEIIKKDVNFEALAKLQEEDTEILRGDTRLKHIKIPIPGSITMLYCNTATSTTCSFVTKLWKRHIFHLLHGLAHPGIKATVKLIIERYVWSQMQKDCKECKQGKTNGREIQAENIKQAKRRDEQVAPGYKATRSKDSIPFQEHGSHVESLCQTRRTGRGATRTVR